MCTPLQSQPFSNPLNVGIILNLVHFIHMLLLKILLPIYL